MTGFIIVLIIVGVIAIAFHSDSQENKDRIRRSGGMYQKYKVLVDALKDDGNIQLQIVRQTSENLVLQYVSAGGRTTIYFNQIWKKLQVKWDMSSPFYGDHKLSWTFMENEDQLQMAKQIHNAMVDYQVSVMNSYE